MGKDKKQYYAYVCNSSGARRAAFVASTQEQADNEAQAALERVKASRPNEAPFTIK